MTGRGSELNEDLLAPGAAPLGTLYHNLCIPLQFTEDRSNDRKSANNELFSGYDSGFASVVRRNGELGSKVTGIEIFFDREPD
jgi:hypothetical protein